MSYYIRAPKNRNSWYLWETTYKEGKRKRDPVPVSAYSELGFRQDMVIDEAKYRVSQLNKERSVDRKKFTQAARNEKEHSLRKAVYMPQQENDRFIEHLTENNISSSNNLEKIFFHWQSAQKLIRDVQLLPDSFFKKRMPIYLWLINQKHSLSYSKKVIRVLNKWGEFKSHQQGQDYLPVPNPKGNVAQKIADANHDKSGKRKVSAPLTPELLKKMQEPLQQLEGQYEWMYVSLWLGLRPYEIDQLKGKNHYKLRVDKETEVTLIEVYQPKLGAVARDLRWKTIPLFLPEQIKALEFIKKGDLKRPLTKTIQKYSEIEDLTLYGGRKAFTDLMLSKQQTLENIATWMGHRSINTTWNHYKQKNLGKFTKVA